MFLTELCALLGVGPEPTCSAILLVHNGPSAATALLSAESLSTILFDWFCEYRYPTAGSGPHPTVRIAAAEAAAD